MSAPAQLFDQTKLRPMAVALSSMITALPMIEGELMRRSFYRFVLGAWSVLEPGSNFKSNWHIAAICEYLEAVTAGEIKRLIINIPPRFAKSTIVSVLWPAWCWTNHPEIRFLTSSYSRDLATRDAVSSRRLMESDWYRAHFGYWFKFTSDQNVKTRFENNKRGVRVTTSVDSGTTGDGGNIRIIDDPISAQDALNSTARQVVNDWWRETFSTRGQDPETDAVVLVMQRFAVDDLTGYLLDQGGWEHLCFPMRLDLSSKIKPNCKDPRTKDGELLFPARYDEEAVKTLERDLGQYGVAGQLQQNPVPREGQLFKVDLLKIVDKLPSPVVASARYWDKAGTDGGTGARTAGVLMHRLQDGSYCVAHVTKGRWSAGEREAKIKAQAAIDGVDIPVYVEQEPGSGGKESAQSTITNLAGFIVRADLPGSVGSKEVRADPFAVQVEGGNVYLLRGEWNQEFVDELRPFPAAKLKDQVDAASGAFAKVAVAKTAPVITFPQDDELTQNNHWRMSGA